MPNSTSVDGRSWRDLKLEPRNWQSSNLTSLERKVARFPISKKERRIIRLKSMARKPKIQGNETQAPNTEFAHGEHIALKPKGFPRFLRFWAWGWAGITSFSESKVIIPCYILGKQQQRCGKRVTGSLASKNKGMIKRERGRGRDTTNNRVWVRVNRGHICLDETLVLVCLH